MIFEPEEWQARLAAHEERADALTADHRARRNEHRKHPIHDFLFEYYPVRPTQLRRWHPGVGARLLGSPPHREWRDYMLIDDRVGGVGIDLDGLLARRGSAFSYIRHLLDSTMNNPAHFDCFGLHEWAMVYRTENPRHDLPLRLGAAGTDAVVETHQLRCTHFDAYRFFTEPARPLNLTVLSRDDQPAHDQCGCLHATMDLYKWAAKLGPLVPGDLWLDTFELARDTRILDMEASPYDVRDLGYGVVAIETPEGKSEYVARQRELSQRATPLRHRLVGLINEAMGAKLSR